VRAANISLQNVLVRSLSVANISLQNVLVRDPSAASSPLLNVLVMDPSAAIDPLQNDAETCRRHLTETFLKLGQEAVLSKGKGKSSCA